MFSQDSAYSSRKMDFTDIDNEPATPETPRFQRNVKRSLLNSFIESEDATPIAERNTIENTEPMITSIPVDDDSYRGEMNETHGPREVFSWNGFITFWILVILFGCAVAYAIYTYFPRYMVLCLTKEFMISGILGLVCLILFSVVLKLWNRENIVCVPPSPIIHNTDQSTSKRNVRFTPSLTTPTFTPRARNQASSFSSTASGYQIPVKRTFKGEGEDIWTEYIRYFENIVSINDWDENRTRRVFFTVLRGQAETYAYGLTEEIRNSWTELKRAMENRFGHRVMKESYIAEVKMRRKRTNETFRDFGQAIEDLYRKAYPDNREYIKESSLKTFLDNCSEDSDFRYAVKRIRPKTLQDAITAAMQEECIRLGENSREHYARTNRRTVYAVSEDFRNANANKSTQQMKPRFEGNRRQPKRCFQCNSTDHLSYQCPVNKRSGGKQNSFNIRKNVDQQLNSSGPRQ